MENEQITSYVARLVSYPHIMDGMEEIAFRLMVKKLLIPNDIKNCDNHSESEVYKNILWHLNTIDEVCEQSE
ncbi:hypothetical protein [Paenibacillus medicaginis]|uniref:Uncharacterized protein n=1 Tax=Paenibacillus medicaginis TaxID=1470560 RepID=A0ABV5BUK9_9BACL